ncbi:hypothetical protein BDZ85DRAFT_254665 [Elsinoe ampelina]|uniref:HAM1-like N-terminal domain-containing protein n=1 Tax=Elsinoe ampelina TaxID=302913 RepID=A0A6A6GQ94_9PEZI|nr:hypothetical protein BDZ85DRAFT_254665 [Elsinoe ampelina]
MSSCFGLRKSKDDDRQPLLPQYEDDTTLQRELHQKLHTYQMLRAFGQGYMPSTEQTIVHLRTLLAADILNPHDTALSDSGRLLIKYSKRFLQQLMDLLQNKASEDQIQDFIYYLSKSRIHVDTDKIARRTARSNTKASARAAYDSFNTVSSLLLTNSDFRIFLSDLNTVAREVFQDTAQSVSKVANQAAKQIENNAPNGNDLSKPTNGKVAAPTGEDLQHQVGDVVEVVATSTATVVQDAEESALEKLKGDEGDAMIGRLKSAVSKLRQRPDYSESVSVLSTLFKRVILSYSRVAEDVAAAVEDSVSENAELDRAAKNLWLSVRSFGDSKAWDELESQFRQLTSHLDKDPEFEKSMIEVGNGVQAMLTDPSFFDNAQDRIEELKEKSRQSKASQNMRDDIENFLRQLEVTAKSVLEDKDVARLVQTSTQLFHILSPHHSLANQDLITDAVNVFIPVLINSIQNIPIPRLEVSTPEIDLLLEPLIISPGQTINHTSFLPHHLRIETFNAFDVRAARFRTVSTSSHNVTLKLDGVSATAQDVGFWLRAHAGFFRLADEGIASFALDERGMDIHIDVEIAKERMEKMVTLKDVRVHIHKFNYKLKKSKFSFLSWIIKPLLRPILRKVMEKQLAEAVAEFFHSANRELLFARERLRATRIADPKDLVTFFKAIAARLTPEDDGEVYTRVGVDEPGKGIFKGVYAPGSVVKVWREEAREAAERIEEGGDVRGWRNEVFDMHVRAMS